MDAGPPGRGEEGRPAAGAEGSQAWLGRMWMYGGDGGGGQLTQLSVQLDFDSGHDLRVMRSSPAAGYALNGKSA